MYDRKKIRSAQNATDVSFFCSVSDSSSNDSTTYSSHEDEEEDEDAPPPIGGDKKRKVAPIGEAEGSKKGRTLLPDCSTTAVDSEDKWLLRAKPLAKS